MVVGRLRFWIDIFKIKSKKEAKAPPKKVRGVNSYDSKSSVAMEDIAIWDISPVPPQKMELRIIIWETNNVPPADIEGTTDIFVQVVFGADRKNPKVTDTHFRSMDGFVKKLINIRALSIGELYSRSN